MEPIRWKRYQDWKLLMFENSPFMQGVKTSILGAPIDAITMTETIDLVEETVRRGEFAHFIGVNADKLLQMRDCVEMDRIVRRCEVVNADGASMLIAAKVLGISVPERVAGIDLLYKVCERAEQKGFSVYLLGATSLVVNSAESALRHSYPDLRIVGTRDGYFTEPELPGLANLLKDLNPDIVLVGITSPKKERVIEYFREQGLRGVYLGVGGSFDVVSGTIPRAPRWLQKLNLEWLFRMWKEPRRLLRRYVVGNSRFLWILLNEKICGRKKLR